MYRNYFFLLQERKKIKMIFLLVCLVITILYFYIPSDVFNRTYQNMILFSLWVMYAISCKHLILSNRIVMFLSSISFEIYLSHMFIYRVIEKTMGVYFLGNGWASYIIVYILDILGCVIFIGIWSRIYNWIKQTKLSA